ncbi:MAG: M14 family zinc carboxypeptidase [Deltaproteobacteria bacterium]|nr:M14 family zinc carboxypeptidase [Deltaproteobacteria bacterium]
MAGFVRPAVVWAAAEIEVDVRVESRAELDRLSWLGLPILARHGPRVTLSVDPLGLSVLEAAGFHPLARDITPLAAGYPTYGELVERLEDYAADHPDFATLYDLGPSQSGEREIWAVKVSDEVSTNQAEPVVVLDASIHGNEQIGTLVLLAFLDRLADGWDNGDAFGELAADFEIWIVPVVNADGYAAVRRSNDRFVDLNRNFGMNWRDEATSGGGPASESEVRIMTGLYIAANAALAVQYHSGSELVNYPLDSTPQAAPDEDTIIAISEAYGDAANYGIINGYDWYQVNGISEEASYESAGTLSVIVEISYNKMPGVGAQGGYVDRNIDGLAAFIPLAATGVSGFVTDAVTDAPVEALLIPEDGWPFFTDPENGDFHRVLPAGTHTVRVLANGYKVRDVQLTASAQKAESVSIQLYPDDVDPVVAALRPMTTIMNRPFGNFSNKSFPKDATGHPDALAYSLGQGGELVLDMGSRWPLGADEPLTVYELDNDAADSYAVAVSSSWTGPWTDVGTGSGTREFSLTGIPKEELRYVRIVDAGTTGTPAETPGADIDAVTQSAACLPPGAQIEASPTSGGRAAGCSFYGGLLRPPRLSGVLRLGPWRWRIGGSRRVRLHVLRARRISCRVDGSRRRRFDHRRSNNRRWRGRL